MRCIGDQGIAGVSVRTIGKAAGVSLATVHHYFGSKAELHEQVLEFSFQRFGGLQSELVAGLAQPGSVESKIERTARIGFRFGLAHSETSRMLLRAQVFDRDDAALSEVAHARLREAQRGFLDVASVGIGALVGRPPASLRVPLQGLMFLLTRMAVTSTEELRILCGADDVPPEDVQDLLENYVVQVALATLIEPPKRTS